MARMIWSKGDDTFFTALLYGKLGYIDCGHARSVAAVLSKIAEGMTACRRRRFTDTEVLLRLVELKDRFESFEVFLRTHSISYDEQQNRVEAHRVYFDQFGPGIETPRWRDFRLEGIPDYITMREVMNLGLDVINLVAVLNVFPE